MEQIGENGLFEIYKGEGVKFSYNGSALYVQDGIFITMAGRLKTAIRMLTVFLLPMGILVFIAGYVISHLLANGRVTEFALFRSLGMKQAGAVWLFWSEQFVLVFVGNVLGCLAALLLLARIVELLCKLAHEENYAVIIVTHNEAVADAADVVYGMSDGTLSVVRG